jgi:hypothetical protein
MRQSPKSQGSFQNFSAENNNKKNGEKMGFLKFMSSPAGRWLRAIVGAVLLVWGVATNSLLLDLLGVFFVAVGAVDVCVFAPLFGKPFSGKALRLELSKNK